MTETTQHKKVCEALSEIEDLLKDVSRQLYENPELPFEEYQSAALLADEAEKAGFSVQRGAGGLETAFLAEKKGSGDGPVIAFLAEYDALPGLGHGCGHNIIAASSLGAALALGAVLDQVGGKVLLVGTPAEEGGGGKALLANEGLFEEVDAAMLVHPSARTIVARWSLASAGFKLKFYGQTAHAAAAPDEGINALDALIQTYNSINARRQHLPPDTRVHGIITKGGEAPNIVPDYAEGHFLVRAMELDNQEKMIQMLKDCAEASAKAMGARVEVEEYKVPYDPMKSNSVLADLYRKHLGDMGWEESDVQGAGGSTDMGNVSQVVPALHPMMSLSREKDSVVGHTREFADATMTPEGEECLLASARALALTGLDVLLDPSLAEKAWEEFRQED